MILNENDVHVYRFKKGDHHADVKKILSHYLGAKPQTITISRDKSGKPVLSGEYEGKLYFNISHTENKVMLAVASRPVGIDFESVSRKVDYKPILKRYFSSVEQNDFNDAISKRELTESEIFFRGWVKKESILKAVGIGLSGIKDYEISFSNSDSSHCYNGEEYRIADFCPEAGYCASIAYKGSRLNIVMVPDVTTEYFTMSSTVENIL